MRTAVDIISEKVSKISLLKRQVSVGHNVESIPNEDHRGMFFASGLRDKTNSHKNVSDVTTVDKEHQHHLSPVSQEQLKNETLT